MEIKQTAVEYLQKTYFKTGMLYQTDFQKAKQMEREQIANAWNDGHTEGREGGYCSTYEEYYKETYGGQGE